MTIRRGEIWLACLDPALGREIAKTRPVVVVSNDRNNEFSGTVSVLPVTSTHVDRIYPFEVFLPKGAANLPRDSRVKADQIRTLDKARLIRRVGVLATSELSAVDAAMKVHLDLE
jgi:mRNA interferase MazF